MSALHFKCTLCGACCDAGGPELSIGEALRWQELFALSVRLVAARPGRNPDALVATMKQLGTHVRISRPDGPSLHYYVYGTIYVMVPEGKPCPALADRLCSLHPDKPQVCATAPFAAGIPEALQAGAYERWRDYECVDHQEGEAVYADGRIVDPEYRAHYRKGIVDLKRDQPVISKLVSRIPAHLKGPMLEQATGERMLIPFANLLPELQAARLLAGGDTAALAAAQLRAIAAVLDESVPPRGPVDRALREAQKIWRGVADAERSRQAGTRRA